MGTVAKMANFALLLALLSLPLGCAEFWSRPPGVNGAATRPSPAESTAAALGAAAALAAGTPVSPFLSLTASLLAIGAATYARTHSKAAKRSACQAGVLLEAFTQQGGNSPGRIGSHEVS